VIARTVTQTESVIAAIMNTSEQIRPCHVKIVNAMKLVAMGSLVTTSGNVHAIIYSLVISAINAKIPITYHKVNQTVNSVVVTAEEQNQVQETVIMMVNVIVNRGSRIRNVVLALVTIIFLEKVV